MTGTTRINRMPLLAFPINAFLATLSFCKLVLDVLNLKLNIMTDGMRFMARGAAHC